MSDRSSESSGEWVVLSETDPDLSLENVQQPLNLELNYDAVCDAVSDSIRSSLSTEELEWQYEQFEEYIPTYSPSCIEELYPQEFDASCTKDPDTNQVQEDDISKCAFTSDYEDIDLAAVPKIRCYKHNRNEHLNFILNVMLALVVSSSIGLGIGHFLGWSHKCYTKLTEKAAASDDLQDILKIHPNLQATIETEKQSVFLRLFNDNLSDSLPCLNSKDTRITADQEISNVVLTETSTFKIPDALKLKNQEENHNHSDLGILHVSDIIPTHLNWNNISNNKVSTKNEFSEFNLLLPVKVDNLFDRNVMKHTEFESSTEYFIYNKGSFMDNFQDSQGISSSDINNLYHEDEVESTEFELLKQFYIKDTIFYGENNLTNQLRRDLNQVIESVRTIISKHITHFQKKHTATVDDSEAVMKLYNDFQSLINLKITDIENFIFSAEYKANHKPSLKYLQKMIYSLVGSVDYLMKVSFKPLTRENKRINVHKLSNNISKVIFNFNKKWEKNSRFWDATLEKVKFRETREKPFKKEKKHSKMNFQFEKNNKFKRYSMKS